MRRSLVGVLCDGLASSDLVRLRLTDFTVYGIVVGPPTWRRLCTPVMVVVDRGERDVVWVGPVLLPPRGQRHRFDARAVVVVGRMLASVRVPAELFI